MHRAHELPHPFGLVADVGNLLALIGAEGFNLLTRRRVSRACHGHAHAPMPPIIQGPMPWPLRTRRHAIMAIVMLR
jgi:hypothetical protein